MGRKRKKAAKNASGEAKNLHSKINPVNTLNSVAKVTEVSVAAKSAKKEQLVENLDVVGIPKEQNLGKQPTEQSEEVKKSIDNQFKENSNGIISNQQQLGQQTRGQYTMENNSQTNHQKIGELGGVIFLCNAKTKPDCFRYMVLGFPDSRIELVMSIKPDLKLFLYDYHFKVLYGIYKAVSAGGMRLEPAAFNGGFPAQVRFKVDQECAPLPISTLCGLLQNFDARANMVKPELSVEQVEKLTGLFLQNKLAPRTLNLSVNPQAGVNPTMPLRPLVPGQTLPHQHLGSLFNPHQILRANSQLAVELVRAYGSTLTPQENPPVPPEVPVHNHIASSAINHQAYTLQPHYSAPAAAALLAPANPVPALNSDMGGVDSRHSAHANSQLASNEAKRYTSMPISNLMSLAKAPFSNPISSSEFYPQAHNLQPQLRPVTPSLFPSHTMPPASNSSVGRFDSHQSMSAEAQVASGENRKFFTALMPKEMVPAPREVPPALSQMGLQNGPRPKFPAPDPSTMPISHKYAFELNPDVGRLGSQQSEQANSQLTSNVGRTHPLPQVSEHMLQMPTKVPFLNDGKLNERNHMLDLQPLLPSVAPGLLPVSSTNAPERPDHYPHLPRGLTTRAESVDLPSRKMPCAIKAERADFQHHHDYHKEARYGDQILDRSWSNLSDRMHLANAANMAEVPDDNRRQHQQNSNLDTDSLPVSSRYAFDGPPLKYR